MTDKFCKGIVNFCNEIKNSKFANLIEQNHGLIINSCNFVMISSLICNLVLHFSCFVSSLSYPIVPQSIWITQTIVQLLLLMPFIYASLWNYSKKSHNELSSSSFYNLRLNMGKSSKNHQKIVNFYTKTRLILFYFIFYFG